MTKDGTTLAIDSAQLLSTFFTLIPVPAAIVDPQGDIVLSNSAFNDVFGGLSRIATMRQREMEIPGRGVFDIQTVPLNDQGFRIVHAVDVTDKARLRQKVSHLDRMAAVGRVVTGVAHDLNNPFADISGYRPLIQECDLEPRVRDIMDVVFARAERAGQLVQDVLVLAGRSAPRRIPFDLNAIVRSAVEVRAQHHEGRSYRITLDLDRTIPLGAGDPSQIEQVVDALLINAEDAVPAQGGALPAIQVRTASVAGRIQLHVSDNGYGRASARVLSPHDAGVGLNVCAEIVKDHGGDLYAWSACGDGTTFTLELPAHEMLAKPNSRSGGAARILRGRNVLVVDDEVHITEMIFDVLTRYGALTHIVNSGTEAYDAMLAGSFDLVISDQRIPGPGGQSLFQLAGDDALSGNRRFLFTTGDSVTALKLRSLTRPGIRLIRKPFRIQDLLEGIQALFNQIPLQGF